MAGITTAACGDPAPAQTRTGDSVSTADTAVSAPTSQQTPTTDVTAPPATTDPSSTDIATTTTSAAVEQGDGDGDANNPNEGGTPILINDPLKQPLGIGGQEVKDLTAAKFSIETPQSLGEPTRLVAFADYTAIAYVYATTEFGPIIIKEGVNASPNDLDAIVKAVDDTATPERSGTDKKTGHSYLAVDTAYGTALVESVNDFVTIYFTFPNDVYLEVHGADRSLTTDAATKLALTITFKAS